MKKILILSDNKTLLFKFVDLTKQNKFDRYIFNYAFSFNNKQFLKIFANSEWIRPINIKKEINYISENYYLVFSIHSKQLFPKELVNSVKCINVHPGLNPYNRGWFPQVFSIINKLPFGATIHEIDEFLDHGLIIAQKQVKIEQWDTSLSAYNKVINAEMDLLKDSLINILELNYKAKQPKNEGNINFKKDFDNLCKIDLENKDTFRNHIDKLRALSHGNYKNAFFYDKDGNKITISVNIENENALTRE